MIIPSLSFGGAENIAVGLAEEATNNGYAVDFITLYSGNDYESRLKKINANVTCLKYSNGFGASQLFNILKLRRRLFDTIKTINPNIIHTHLFLVKMMLFKKKLPYPVIDTQHDISPWWAKTSFSDRVKTFIEKKFVHITADKVIAISHSVEQNLIEHIDVSQGKVETIFNFVEPNNQLEKTIPSNEDFILTVVSRIQVMKKGLDLLADAISILVQKYNAINFKVVVVGDGPDLDLLKNLVKKNSLEEFFCFEGYQKDIYSYYNRSNLILMPSRWEGFGLTAAEAAISGRAVLGFNIPGLNEVVLNNETGILVQPYDVDLFAQAIIRLKEDRKTLTQLSLKALELGKNRFSKEVAFEKYNLNYDSLISRSS
jgi:glycosyltransferase involved in cell wall biosynthesis